MIELYDNPFSPFTRKVRMVLYWKELPFESIDGLALDNLEELGKLNPRREVPVLADDAVLVVGSSDIVAYLDHRYPPAKALPEDPTRRVEARAWERLANTVVDAILHDISLWMWPTHHRTDEPPEGLVEAGRRDLQQILARVETRLSDADFLCGEVSIADVAMFPHVQSLKVLGLAPDRNSMPQLGAWIDRMRSLPWVRRDLDTVRRGVEKLSSQPSPYEAERVVWRGDRLEWLFARGFHAWWAEELAAGRAVVPTPLL